MCMQVENLQGHAVAPGLLHYLNDCCSHSAAAAKESTPLGHSLLHSQAFCPCRCTPDHRLPPQRQRHSSVGLLLSVWLPLVQHSPHPHDNLRANGGHIVDEAISITRHPYSCTSVETHSPLVRQSWQHSVWLPVCTSFMRGGLSVICWRATSSLPMQFLLKERVTSPSACAGGEAMNRHAADASPNRCAVFRLCTEALHLTQHLELY